MADTEYQEVAVADLEANAWNPNAMDEASLERLTKEIEEVGFLDPLQVVALDTGKYRIIGGEHRYEAVKALGWETVPAMVLTGDKWQDEDLQKFVTVRLNVLSGKLDPGRMAALYDEMAKKYGEEALQELFAYTDKRAWKDMLGSISKGLKEAGVERDKIKEFEEKTKEVSSLEDIGKILNDMLSQYGETVQHNFMVFTYGNKKHLYIACDPSMWKVLSRVTRFCKEYGEDINEFMAGVLDECLAKARAAAKDRKKVAASDDAPMDDVPF